MCHCKGSVYSRASYQISKNQYTGTWKINQNIYWYTNFKITRTWAGRLIWAAHNYFPKYSKVWFSIDNVMKHRFCIYIWPIHTTFSLIHCARQTFIYHVHLFHHKTKNITPVMSSFFLNLHLLFWLWSIFLHSL